MSSAAIRTAPAYSAVNLKLELIPTSHHEVFVSGYRVTDFTDRLGR